MPSLSSPADGQACEALSWHEPVAGSAWAKPPELTGELPASRWKAGQARPFAALGVGYESSVSLAYSMAFLGVVCLAKGLSLAGLAWASETASLLNIGVVLAQKPIGVFITELSGRELGASGVRAAARVAAVAGRASWAGFKEAAAGAGGWAARLAGAKSTAARLDEFSKRCLKDARRLRRQSIEESLRRPEALSEVGAWRAAREFMDKGMPGAAAKIWLARPFNPDWRVKCSYGGQFLKVGFKEALEAMLTRPAAADQADYVRQTLRLMSAAQESVELGASTPRPSLEPESQARAKARPRL